MKALQTVVVHVLDIEALKASFIQINSKKPNSMPNFIAKSLMK